MTHVQVIFQGIILWWMASSPAVVLIPDLTAISHNASISALQSAFAGGVCPPGFVLANSTCSFALNGAGNAGGVQIELATNGSPTTMPLTPQNICPVPSLSAGDLRLRPAYIPATGTGNAAWMTAVGGTAQPVIASCSDAPDCPRYVSWSVDAATGSSVVLVLKNLKSNVPFAAVLNDGARLTILNAPDATVSHERLMKRQSAAKQKESATTQPVPVALLVEDWCAYFSMVEQADGSPLPCPTGAPPIPVCPVRGSIPEQFQTIACSNSQYP